MILNEEIIKIMKQLFSILLIIILISGCKSTRKIIFYSSPTGANVSIHNQQKTTPCTFKLKNIKTKAVVSLNDDRKKEVFIEPTKITNQNKIIKKVGSYSLKTLSIPMLLFGIVLGGYGFWSPEHKTSDKLMGLSGLGLIGFSFHTYSKGKDLKEKSEKTDYITIKFNDENEVIKKVYNKTSSKYWSEEDNLNAKIEYEKSLNNSTLNK